MKTEERNRTRQRHTWWGPLARGKARSGSRHAWRPTLLSPKLSLLRGALVESLTAPLRVPLGRRGVIGQGAPGRRGAEGAARAPAAATDVVATDAPRPPPQATRRRL
jgi:hypothetical protein